MEMMKQPRRTWEPETRGRRLETGDQRLETRDRRTSEEDQRNFDSSKHANETKGGDMSGRWGGRVGEESQRYKHTPLDTPRSPPRRSLRMERIDGGKR